MKIFISLLALVPMLALGQIKQQAFTTNSGLVVSNIVTSLAGGSVTASGQNNFSGSNYFGSGQTTYTNYLNLNKPFRLFSTPTWWVAYGDSITEGAYVTNGYVAQLTNLFTWNQFTQVNYGQSSYHIGDVSNSFYGFFNSGDRSFTNKAPTWNPGKNAILSIWVGINDILFDVIDTNVWITTLTNMYWTAKTNNYNPVIAFTIEDATGLTGAQEQTRTNLNAHIRNVASSNLAWMVLIDNDLTLPTTNSIFYLYNVTAGNGLHPTDFGHQAVAQALGSSIYNRSNSFRGAYYDGFVWAEQGFNGNGQYLFNLNAGNIGSGTVPSGNLPVKSATAAGTGGITVTTNTVSGNTTYTVSLGSVEATPQFYSRRTWFRSGNPDNMFGSSASDSLTATLIGATSTRPQHRLAYTSTATNNGSFWSDNYGFFPQKNTSFVIRAGLTNAAGVRAWIGAADAPGAQYNADSGRLIFAFRLSTTNSPNWFLVNDNDGSHLTTRDTGIAADSGDHTFRLEVTGTASLVGYIDGTPVGTNTSNLAFNDDLFWFTSVCTLTNENRGIRFYQFYGAHDF